MLVNQVRNNQNSQIRMSHIKKTLINSQISIFSTKYKQLNTTKNKNIKTKKYKETRVKDEQQGRAICMDQDVLGFTQAGGQGSRDLVVGHICYVHRHNTTSFTENVSRTKTSHSQSSVSTFLSMKMNRVLAFRVRSRPQGQVRSN